MTDQTDEKYLRAAEAEDYKQLLQQFELLVNFKPDKRLEAAKLMNASLVVGLKVFGRQELTRILRRAIKQLPAAEAQAKGRLA